MSILYKSTSSSTTTCYVFLPTNQKEVVAVTVGMDDTFEDLLSTVWKMIFPSDDHPNHTDYYFLHCTFALNMSAEEEVLHELSNEEDNKVDINMIPEIPAIPALDGEEGGEKLVEMVERMEMGDFVINCFSESNPHPRFLLRSLHHGIEGSVVHFTTSQDRLEQYLLSDYIHPREYVGSCVLSKKGLKSLCLSVNMDMDMDMNMNSGLKMKMKMNEEKDSKGEKIGNVLLDDQKECDCCVVGQSR